MADVFISYKRDERASVEQLAARLRALNLSVWFDASMSAGESFNDEIDREARTAKSILVCWSPTARDSRWVKAEAMIGFEQDKLAAAYVNGPDGFSPPTPFNTIHAEDLRAWLAAPSDSQASWRSLLRRIGKLCGRADIESWGALDAQASAAELRAWLAAHEQSPLFMTVETMLSERNTQDVERDRLEQAARQRRAEELAEERRKTAALQEQEAAKRAQQEARRTREADVGFLRPEGKDVFGHPRGLGYLVFCEAWERFSYYGMQALLVLYLTQYLLLPGNIEHVVGFEQFKAAVGAMYQALGYLFGLGHGGELATPLATAAAITGVYSAGVYLTPLIGGWIADQFLGRTATVTLGASLMVLGHFLMAFDASFVAAIACLFLGVGCFKGNIASQVGELYGPDDLRRSNGYQVFLLGIQIAVIAAPLVIGFLGERIAWHYGFGAAGAGMAIALVVYLLGRKYLPPERPRGAAAKAAPQVKLTQREWATMVVLILMVPVLSMTAIGNQEIFNAYLLWGDTHYDLVFFGEKMPTSWLVSLDAIISTVTVGGALTFWTIWAKYRKEPDEIIKIAVGAAIAAGAPLLLAFASAYEAQTGQKVSLLWGVGFHIINDVGFAMIFPVGLALYSRAAPRKVGGLFIGIYYLHLFMCNLATGKVAGFVETMDGFTFWAMHAAIIGGGAVILVLFALFARKLLAPTAADLGQSAEAAAQPA